MNIRPLTQLRKMIVTALKSQANIGKALSFAFNASLTSVNIARAFARQQGMDLSVGSTPAAQRCNGGTIYFHVRKTCGHEI